MSRRERKKQETRGNIMECALSFFRENGFQETSMEEIAEKADVSKGTLYNYFNDKESILVAYFQTIIAEYSEKNKKNDNDSVDLKTRLYSLMDFVNGIFKNEMELAEIYFRYRMQSRFSSNIIDESQRSGIEKWMLEIIEEAQRKGELRIDIPSIILARNFQFLTMSFFISKMYTKEPIEIDSIKNQLVELFLNGAKS